MGVMGRRGCKGPFGVRPPDSASMRGKEVFMIHARHLTRRVLQFDGAESFSEGLAPVRIGDDDTGKWGYIYR